MSPEERAERLWDLLNADYVREWTYMPGAQEALASAIREAVLAEREACAKIADGYGDAGDFMAPAIAAAIRSRSEPQPVIDAGDVT